MIRLSRHAMGTRFETILSGSDPEFLEAAGNEALDEIERLEARLSHYRPDSEICGINARAAAEPVLVEPSLLGLLWTALSLSEITGGAFDPTMGALIRCWGFFRGTGRLPEPEEIEEARARAGRGLLRIDPDARTVRFLREGVQLHLGGFGKGYAIDRVAEILRELRVEAALVHGGGSTIYGLGAPPGEDAWLVGVRDPRKAGRRLGVVRLRDRAFSTSGDYEQFFEAEGRRYSHILDPRTGYPAQGTWSAAVLAESATATDALSTAAFVLGVEGTRALCETYRDLGAVLVPDPGPESGADCEVEVVALGNVEFIPGDPASIDNGDDDE